MSTEVIVPGVLSVSQVAAAVTGAGGGVPAKPAVNANGMNLNAFGGVNSGAVDLASGVFSYSATDVNLPGRKGMNLSVSRSYNSREFKASPKWSSLEGDAFYNYAGQDLKALQWQSATPAQWGGWIGNGWKTSISGRLLYVRIEGRYRKADWWGANELSNDHTDIEIAIIQTANGSYSFEREYRKTKDGVKISDSHYINRDKGSQVKLTRGVQGFTLIYPNGNQQIFRENYYNKSFSIKYYSETFLRSVHTDYKQTNTVSGEYLSQERDTMGNSRYIEYEKGPRYDFETEKETLPDNFMTTLEKHVADGSVGDTASGIYAVYAIAKDPNGFAVSLLAQTVGKAVVSQIAAQTINGMKAAGLENMLPDEMVMAYGVEIVNGMLQRGLLNENGEIAIDLTRIEVGPMLKVAAEQALQEMVKESIKGFIKGLLNVVFRALDAIFPGLGFIVELIVNMYINAFLSDVSRGEWVSRINVTPMRPIRLYDDAGQEIHIRYVEAAMPPVAKKYRTETYEENGWNPETERYEKIKKTRQVREEYDFAAESDNHSRIAALEYAGPKGPESVKYSYDANGVLIAVDHSDGRKESYGYTHYGPSTETNTTAWPGQTIAFDSDKGKAAKYDNAGLLLTSITSDKGTRLNLSYTYVQGSVLRDDLTGDEDARLSGFVVTKREVTGKKDAQTPLTQSWQYEGYEKLNIYSVLRAKKGSSEKANRSGFFPEIRMLDPKGQETVSRFEQGLPVETRNALGHRDYQTWDWENRRPLMVVKDSKGFQKITHYKAYDDYGYPTEVLDSGTHTTPKTVYREYERRNVYLDAHVLDKVKREWVESDGRRYLETEYRYDSGGKGLVERVSRSSGAGQSETRYTYDRYGNVTEVRSPSGVLTQYSYENGIWKTREKISDVNWEKTWAYYPNSMWVSRETDILGQETLYVYDARGRVLSQRSMRGPSVAETTMRYSDDPDNLNIEMQVRTTGGMQDKEVSGKFNQYGKPYEITVIPKGQTPQTTRYSYGPTLEIESVTDHLGRTTRYSYEALDRLSEIRKPDGSKVSVVYEDAGNTKIVTDENGNATRYRYDARDNLVQVRLPNVYVAYYKYNGLDKLSETIDMRNLKTQYHYDEAGNLTEKVNPNGTRERYTYDVENRILSKTDAKEQTTRYNGYDSQGRPKEIMYGDGTRVGYVYDRGYPGTLSEVTVEGSDPQRYRYSYTALGQRESEEKELGGETYRIEYGWDDTGLLLRRRDSLSGRWQENSYDSLGRITGVKYEMDGNLTPVVSDIVYTPGSQVSGYSLPRQKLRYTYKYDSNNDRLVEMRAYGPLMLSAKRPYPLKGDTPWEKEGLYLQQGYAYDSVGNLTGLTQEEWDGMRYAQRYVYDVTHQLTGYEAEVVGGKTEHLKYTYDPQGNRLMTVYPRETQRYEIANDSNQLLSKWTGQTKGSEGAWWTYTYDANGNLATGTQSNGKETFAKYLYTWDVKNRLESFVENETERQQNGYEFESGLRYAKEDIRFTQLEPMFERVKQRSLYSDMGEQLLAEQETYSDHKLTRGYVYFGNQRVAVVERREDAQSATHAGSRGSSPGGIERAEALSEKNNKSSIFPEGKDRWTSYVRDQQGTLLMSITDYEAPATDWGITDPRYLDTAGKSRLDTTAKLGANQYYLYPYGAMYHKGFLYSQLQATEYTGKPLDEGTQWYYFHARHYDSAYGRFIGHDLVAPDMSNPLTLNPFLYCLNNPGRWVDPDGRAPILVPLAIAATAVIMNPVPTDTEGGRWQATKGMVVDIAAGVVGEQAIAAIGGKLLGLWAGRGSKVANPVPEMLARVVADTPITRSSKTLGKLGDVDVFVTSAKDIRGLNSFQIAEKLTIPYSPSGFKIIEFSTPEFGIASPINRFNPGFVGGGKTLGGASEFIVPNSLIPDNATTWFSK